MPLLPSANEVCQEFCPQGRAVCQTPPLDRYPPGRQAPPLGRPPLWPDITLDRLDRHPPHPDRLGRPPGQTLPWPDTPRADLPPSPGQTRQTPPSRRYASYWNAFLLIFFGLMFNGSDVFINSKSSHTQTLTVVRENAAAVFIWKQCFLVDNVQI